MNLSDNTRSLVFRKQNVLYFLFKIKSKLKFNIFGSTKMSIRQRSGRLFLVGDGLKILFRLTQAIVRLISIRFM